MSISFGGHCQVEAAGTQINSIQTHTMHANSWAPYMKANVLLINLKKIT